MAFPCYLALALALLVTRIDANHPDHAPAPDNFAIPADLPDRCPDFHYLPPFNAQACRELFFFATSGSPFSANLRIDEKARTTAPAP